MTSASELFHTRRSRVGRPDPDLGIGSSIDRNYNRRNHLNHRHDLDGCDPLCRPPTCATSTHVPPPSLYVQIFHFPFSVLFLECAPMPFDQGTSQFASSDGLNAELSSRAPPSAYHREYLFGDDFRLVYAGDWGSEISTVLSAGSSPFTDVTSQTEGFQLLQETNKKPPGLTQEALDSLPLEVFSSEEVDVARELSRESRDCSICLESFRDEDELTRLPCGHRYQENQTAKQVIRNKRQGRKIIDSSERTNGRMMMLRSLYRPLERCLGVRAGGDGLMWHTDLKPHASGDYSIAVVQANNNLEDQSQVFTSPLATYVGVYDGHGGPEASRFVNKHLFPFLHKFATEQGGLSADVIRKAFNATEEEFLHLVKRSLPLRPQIASVGSCCLVGAISNDVLYVANLGDSRAVLGKRVSEDKKNMMVAERLSTDHNVGVEEVRKEVEALHPDDSHIVLYTHGVWRIKGIIQVSRSIGDVFLKKPDFYRDPIFQQFGNPVPLKRPVITAEPSIFIRKLNPQDQFLIFASDGLWEQLSDEAAVDIVFKNPRAGIAKRLVRAALQEVAKKKEMKYADIKKIEKGIRRHFHDDITVIVIYLDQHRHSCNNRIKQNAMGCTTAPVDIYSFNADEGDEDLLQTIS
ncbi:hypothetical protein CRYUN_Cryun04dG0061800 [Craigia yunnanensis]